MSTTPLSTIPLELPVRASEAAALADAVFQQSEGRALTDEVRKRLAARAAALELESIRPFWGSLQADPVHNGTFYIAVDGLSHNRQTPLLLRMAPASAPASGLFPKAMLIGRMRPGAGREVVVNAIPFGYGDTEAVRTFAEQVDPAFLPRPHGALPSVTLAPEDPAAEIPLAFEHYAQALKTTGVNFAAFQAPYEACLWGAIRAGWRYGFSAATAIEAKEQVLGKLAYSRYIAAGLSVTAHEELMDLIRVEKMRAGLGRAFAYELVAPEDPAAVLAALREGGRTVQLLAPRYRPEDLPLLAELSRRHNITLSFRAAPGHDANARREIAQATMGRWNYTVESAAAIAGVIADFRS
ncbi:MAG: hypothetical protein R2762_09635 [Bryobacteraceae bacterium]